MNLVVNTFTVIIIMQKLASLITQVYNTLIHNKQFQKKLSGERAINMSLMCRDKDRLIIISDVSTVLVNLVVNMFTVYIETILTSLLSYHTLLL